MADITQILDALRRLLAPRERLTAETVGPISLGEPQEFTPGTIGAERALETLRGAANIPAGYGTAERAAEADIPGVAMGAGSAPLPVPAPVTPPRLLEPDVLSAPNLTATPPPDTAAPVRNLGLAVREFTGPVGERFFTNRPSAEIAPGTGGQFVEGPASRAFIGAPGALPKGFTFEGRRFGGAVTPADLEAAGLRGRQAAEQSARLDAAERQLQNLVAQRGELFRRSGGQPLPSEVAAIDAQIEAARQGLQLAAAENLPAAERALKLAEISRKTVETGTAPGAREQFERGQQLDYAKLANDLTKAREAGTGAAAVTAESAVRSAQIRAESEKAVAQLNAAFRNAGLDKDIAAKFADKIPDILTLIPKEQRPALLAAVIPAIEQAFARVPGSRAAQTEPVAPAAGRPVSEARRIQIEANLKGRPNASKINAIRLNGVVYRKVNGQWIEEGR